MLIDDEDVTALTAERFPEWVEIASIREDVLVVEDRAWGDIRGEGMTEVRE